MAENFIPILNLNYIKKSKTLIGGLNTNRRKTMNYDKHLDLEIEKHLAENAMSEICSDCCGAPFIENTDLCSKCGEHAAEIEMGEYIYQEREMAECDKQDSLRELERERDD